MNELYSNHQYMYCIVPVLTFLATHTGGITCCSSLLIESCFTLILLLCVGRTCTGVPRNRSIDVCRDNVSILLGGAFWLQVHVHNVYM